MYNLHSDIVGLQKQRITKWFKNIKLTYDHVL